MYAIFWILSQTYLAIKQPFTPRNWTESKTISLKPPDSIDKNSNFTLQNTGVVGLPLPRSVGLFVLLCDCNSSVLRGQIYVFVNGVWWLWREGRLVSVSVQLPVGKGIRKSEQSLAFCVATVTANYTDFVCSISAEHFCLDVTFRSTEVLRGQQFFFFFHVWKEPRMSSLYKNVVFFFIY